MALSTRKVPDPYYTYYIGSTFMVLCSYLFLFHIVIMLTIVIVCYSLAYNFYRKAPRNQLCQRGVPMRGLGASCPPRCLGTSLLCRRATLVEHVNMKR